MLDGDPVMYGGASELSATLDYDLNQEKSFSYAGLTIEQVIRHLAFFISRLWQIHVFGEGNTRTTAVFFIQYLRYLKFDVTNDIFAKNAWYFRNALVRANDSNIKKGIHATTSFLETFLRNLLLCEHHPLRNRTMHISGTLKQDDPINDPINDPIKLSEREKKLLALIRENPTWTRCDFAEKLGCSESTVKRALTVLVSKGLIRRVGANKNGGWVITVI